MSYMFGLLVSLQGQTYKHSRSMTVQLLDCLSSYRMISFNHKKNVHQLNGAVSMTSSLLIANPNVMNLDVFCGLERRISTGLK